MWKNFKIGLSHNHELLEQYNIKSNLSNGRNILLHLFELKLQEEIEYEILPYMCEEDDNLLVSHI